MRGQGVDGQKFVVIEGTAVLVQGTSLKSTDGSSAVLWTYNSMLSPVKIGTTTVDGNDPPANRGFPGVAVVGSVVYMFGGDLSCDAYGVCGGDHGDGGSPSDEMWKLELDVDTKAGVWSTIPENGLRPHKRYGHCLETIAEGKLILFGGFGEGNVLRNDLWHFILETQAWEQLSPADPQPSPRSHFGSGVVDGKLYIVFGGDQWDKWYNNGLGKMESFSLETWSWDGIRFAALSIILGLRIQLCTPFCDLTDLHV